VPIMFKFLVSTAATDSIKKVLELQKLRNWDHSIALNFLFRNFLVGFVLENYILLMWTNLSSSKVTLFI
jgi:hypothetical protein